MVEQTGAESHGRLNRKGGHEIAHHSHTHAWIVNLTPEQERELIREASTAISRYAGKPATGWLGPYLAQTPVTLDLLKEEGYRYVLDWPADDQPFWMRTRAGPILSVPYSIELNDSPAMVFRQQGAIDFERMMIDQFDEMLLQSKKFPLFYTIVLHPFIIGQPFRLRALRRALTHISARRDEVWITTPGGVADFIYANAGILADAI